MAPASSAEEPGYLEGTDPTPEQDPSQAAVSQDANAPASPAWGNADAQADSGPQAGQRAPKDGEPSAPPGASCQPRARPGILAGESRPAAAKRSSP
jgi:hypothetical protein